ncbi:ATP-grasp fold amidoligase family protein [Providencia huaxiensis]|uniref:Uncharacterized protein n=1 Tax=Providencia rettgeri TaxID=587 RepID=A0AAD2VRN0_PRORE|nr:hypothetical protein [Providencia rettgeri]
MPSLSYRLFSKYLAMLPLPTRINILFFRRFLTLPNLKEPKTFNEKIQYRKISDRNPLLTIAADKILSKNYVSDLKLNLYIPQNIWIGSSPEDIDKINFDTLPDNYVFKANHTSQTIRIIKERNHLSTHEMKKLTTEWLEHDQSKTLGEWAYENIPKKVFIEEYLDFDGTSPDDYKLFVYHGKVIYIQVDTDRFTLHKRNMFDRDWNDLNFNYSHPRKSPPPKKPDFLDSMINISESIGTNFDFVRVDLYFYKNQVTFGELTIYPGAGFEKFPDYTWDLAFGQPWKLL